MNLPKMKPAQVGGQGPEPIFSENTRTHDSLAVTEAPQVTCKHLQLLENGSSLK